MADDINFYKVIYEILITTKCQLKCTSCLNGIDLVKKQNNLTKKEIENVLIWLKKNVPDEQDYAIVLTGGEPALHPDLNWIIDSLMSHYEKTIISVYTNGLISINVDRYLDRDNIFVRQSLYPGIPPAYTFEGPYVYLEKSLWTYFVDKNSGVKRPTEECRSYNSIIIYKDRAFVCYKQLREYLMKGKKGSSKLLKKMKFDDTTVQCKTCYFFKAFKGAPIYR